MGWNLYHGRDFPPDDGLRTWRSRLLRVSERNDTHAQVNRVLLPEFAATIASREWDVALLQEAPPRWFRALARAARASGALALTSRNVVPALQRPLADLNPDLLASWEGGSNVVLVRGGAVLAEVRRLTLARRPERRRMLWVRVRRRDGREVCVANLHATAGDRAAAGREVVQAARRAVEWAGGTPLVFGGDFNLRPAAQPAPFTSLRDELGLAPPTAPRAIDHLLARGLEVVEAPAALPPDAREIIVSRDLRVRLSDHAIVTATFGMA